MCVSSIEEKWARSDACPAKPHEKASSFSPASELQPSLSAKINRAAKVMFLTLGLFIKEEGGERQVLGKYWEDERMKCVLCCFIMFPTGKETKISQTD